MPYHWDDTKQKKLLLLVCIAHENGNKPDWEELMSEFPECSASAISQQYNKLRREFKKGNMENATPIPVKRKKATTAHDNGSDDNDMTPTKRGRGRPPKKAAAQPKEQNGDAVQPDLGGRAINPIKNDNFVDDDFQQTAEEFWGTPGATHGVYGSGGFAIKSETDENAAFGDNYHA